MQSFSEYGFSLDELLSTLPDLVHIMDTQGRILHVDKKWQNRLGFRVEDCKSLNFLNDILEDRFHTTFHSQINNLHAGQQSNTIPAVIQNNDGEKIAVNIRLISRNTENPLILCLLKETPENHPSQIELQRMFAMSVDMLGVADFHGNFIRLNPAWKHVLGYEINELLSQPFINFVHPDDVERTIEESTRATSHTETSTFENRYRCLDGQYKWISWHYISYPDLQQTYFVARDITEERTNRELLQQARDRLQSILDNSGTIIGLKNLQGQYILVNQEFADIFAGGDKSSLTGKTDADIFPADSVATMRKHDQKVIRDKRAIQFEEHILIGNITRTYLTTRFILEDNQQNNYATCMIAKDITYRKLTEMQLLMRNQAIENSPTGISIADARLPGMPLIYINPAFEANTGYSALDVIGKNCRFLQQDDRDQDGVHEIRAAIRNQKSVSVIIRNYRKDGKMFYNELALAPIHNDNRELTHYVGISTDVTERIKANEKIRRQNDELIAANTNLARARRIAEEATSQLANQNQALIIANRDLAAARKQAEDATRLKSQFLATMSHELRTPLNAIIGYTEIQLAGMTGDINDEQRDYQERILTNAEHLLNLINDILDISKIEAGRMEIVHKAFTLRDLVLDIDNQVRGLADEKTLQFTIEIDERLPEHLIGDPARIKQIVINLLSNAIKFTEHGYIRMNLRKHGRDAFQIMVEDSGIGIAPHMQEIIFEEFRQVDSSTKRKTGGTGLGLSIVRKLLLMMGGTVRVTSQLGEGSIFTITLPLEEEKISLT